MKKLLSVGYASSFVREFHKLEAALRKEVRFTIEEFRDRNNHTQLDVHKLHGRLKNRLSFSVNYKYRVVFEWEGKDGAILKAVGDHDIYK